MSAEPAVPSILAMNVTTAFACAAGLGSLMFADAPGKSVQPGEQRCTHVSLLPPEEACQHTSRIAGRAATAMHVSLLVVCSCPSGAAHTGAIALHRVLLPILE